MEKLIKLLPSQKLFLKHHDEPEFAFCAGIGTGKTFATSIWLIRRFLENRESFLVASQTFSTTKTVQFKALIECLELFGLHEGKDFGYNKSDLIITLNGATIRGGSSQAPNAVTGATKYDGAWFDESAIFDNDARRYLMGRCRGLNDLGKLIEPRYRYTGSPPLEGHTGWYKDFLQEHKDLAVFASMEEAVGKTLSKQYFEQQISIYGGVDNPLCQAQVFGKIIDDNIGCYVFNNSHFRRPKKFASGYASMGIDCAGSGRDFNVFYVIDDSGILDKVKICNADTFKLNSIARTLVSKYDVRQVTIDCTGGFGNGIYDMLKLNKNIDVRGVNFGEQPIFEKKEREFSKDKPPMAYANARAEMYFKLAMGCTNGFCIDDDEAIKQLKAQSYFVNGSGKTQLIEKDAIKKIIGCSPDCSDALALAFYRRSELSNIITNPNQYYQGGFSLYG